MTRTEAIQLIDDYKNKLINPMEMLRWTWLRVILSKLSDEAWEACVEEAVEVMSK